MQHCILKREVLFKIKYLRTLMTNRFFGDLRWKYIQRQLCTKIGRRIKMQLEVIKMNYQFHTRNVLAEPLNTPWLPRSIV